MPTGVPVGVGGGGAEAGGSYTGQGSSPPLLVILRGTNSLGASGWGQGKGLWVLQHGGHDIFQKVVVDGDVVERLLGVCGDVGRVKGGGRKLHWPGSSQMQGR